MTRGTPKTLIDAIRNGLEEAKSRGKTDEYCIALHVIDFLAQHFTVASGKRKDDCAEILALFKRITNRSDL